MNAITPAFGCTTGGQTFEMALDRVLALATSRLGTQRRTLGACPGRVLAEPVIARLDLPGVDQSAMDGYAVRSADVTPGLSLPITGRTAAGDRPGRLAAGGAHRVLTGAPVPHGADAVIAQECIVRNGDCVELAAPPPPGTNLRRRGEDMRAGQTLIPAGTVLDWRHVTILAAQGVTSVPVRRRPIVALLSSGSELCASDTAPAPGQIHDSNQPMLTALLAAWGATPRPMPPVRDDPMSIRAALRDAADNADLVLATAGISVGDEDHVREALRDLGGDLTVVKVAMKPGKPLAAGRLGNAAFIGLPGNPLAALAGAIGFVRPLLAQMAGTDVPAMLQACAGFAMRRRPGRTEFVPVRLAQRDTGLWAYRAGPDGSGRLTPLLAAQGFAFLPAHTGDVGDGDTIAVAPFLPCAVAAHR